jgi:double-stranded RNA-specific adenosine deaminase
MKCTSDDSRKNHALGAVRYVEKRRIGTCQFADRIATVSLNVFEAKIPKAFRDIQKQTCAASIVAHFEGDDFLQVMALGVGTKFLSESTLRAEEQGAGVGTVMAGMDGLQHEGYGTRVRDCHAEVLARRAFRRQLCLEMQDILTRPQGGSEGGYRRILKETQQTEMTGEEKKPCFVLQAGVTLHFYTSSAPCGNAVLKKFSKMDGEKFNDKLPANKWPKGVHAPILGHALPMGQFALLTKKDSTVDESSQEFRLVKTPPTKKVWPALQSDDWCPPGTSTVWYNKGSIHTCSDKLCRWNILGLQGSLLSSLLQGPIFMDTLIVGRKFTPCICRRAICCRATDMPKKRQHSLVEKDDYDNRSAYRLHHPTIMGTGVYMDDSGVLDMTNVSEEGKEVRFGSSLCWAWWSGTGRNVNQNDAECIDGSTGFACDWETDSCVTNLKGSKISSISTASLLRLFGATRPSDEASLTSVTSLVTLRAFKMKASPSYERQKTALLTRHAIFRQWRRRELEVSSSTGTNTQYL